MIDEETRRRMRQYISDTLAKDTLVTSYDITAVPDGYEIDYWFTPVPPIEKITFSASVVKEKMAEWAKKDLSGE